MTSSGGLSFEKTMSMETNMLGEDEATNVLEARLDKGRILKKVIDALKELVTESNFECSKAGIRLQAMDSSHVALVSLFLRAEGFDHFQSARNASLGINLRSMSSILRSCADDDVISLGAKDGSDHLTCTFESANKKRVSTFDLSLMDIDMDALGIPDTTYQATVTMSSAEFQRICREVTVIGDTVSIRVTPNDGVTFTVDGDLGGGNVVLLPARGGNNKHTTGNASCLDGELVGDHVTVDASEPVSQTYALRYLNIFAKASTLSSIVTLRMSANVPLVVEYELASLGHLSYYIAPKLEETE